MRYMIMTALVCAKCKSRLSMDYAESQDAGYEDGDPTGSVMVKHVVEVHPCQNCDDERQRIKSAISTLIEYSKGGK